MHKYINIKRTEKKTQTKNFTLPAGAFFFVAYCVPQFSIQIINIF